MVYDFWKFVIFLSKFSHFSKSLLYNFNISGEWLCLIIEVVRVETDIDGLLGTLPPKQIETKLLIIVTPEFLVCKYDPSNLITYSFVLSIVNNGLFYAFFCYILSSFIIFNFWPVFSIPIMPQDLFVRGIHRVPCFPGQVGLVRLFPWKYSLVKKLGVIASINQ